MQKTNSQYVSPKKYRKQGVQGKSFQGLFLGLQQREKEESRFLGEEVGFGGEFQDTFLWRISPKVAGKMKLGGQKVSIEETTVISRERMQVEGCLLLFYFHFLSIVLLANVLFVSFSFMAFYLIFLCFALTCFLSPFLFVPLF